MLKQNAKLIYLIYFLTSFLFQEPLNAGIGDKYSCQDYANSFYESQYKVNRKKWKSTIHWNSKNISLKFDNFPYIYRPEIVQQDSNSFIAWEYDENDVSGKHVFTLDETNEDYILVIRTLIDSKNKMTSSYFSKCKKI